MEKNDDAWHDGGRNGPTFVGQLLPTFFVFFCTSIRTLSAEGGLLCWGVEWS